MRRLRSEVIRIHLGGAGVGVYITSGMRSARAAPPTPTETPPADHPTAVRRLLPIEDRLDDLRREQRKPQDPADICGVHALRPRQIVQRRMHPSSSISRHRNARASALTIALSTRGRGAHSVPSGVTTNFRPPRFLNISGTWTLIVSRRPKSSSASRRRPPAARHFPDRIGETNWPKRDATAGPHRACSDRLT